VDWTNGTVSFTRKKTGVPVLVHLGSEALNPFKDLPGEGQLFPYLSRVRAGDRATEFASRCRQLGIVGVGEQGQISLRGEDFNALIHGLEVRSKKDWHRR